MAEGILADAEPMRADAVAYYSADAPVVEEIRSNLCPGCKQHRDGSGACPVAETWGELREQYGG